ncbi:MAG: 23S rRNA (adenine(2503)-C(2))-methyltransferase RlmN [Patescibacteria group bacterium]|nr:23S rRNA (adenine(2503)-C(2))-methyltransferase RlmN [Patescibacteria group bacterium]
MNLSKLNQILATEPRYRADQVKRAVFFDLVEKWDEATTLPKILREKLKAECPLEIDAKIFSSQGDPTRKAVITLEDGVKIETVLMSYKSKKEDDETPRNTVCVSSEAGCSLGCVFCATGQNGFTRNLSAEEIVSQVLFFARLLKKENERVSNVVFMGMGEPFLNYEEVIKAIKILMDQKGLAIGARHLSVSTIGIPEKIEKFSHEGFQVNLALSLHAPNDELRTELAPINAKYNLKKVLHAIDDYLAKTKRKVMLEYVMIDGVNDSDFYAKELIQLIRLNIKKERQYLCLVNLIAYNQTGAFKSSPREQILKFKKILEDGGVQVTERFRFGRGIKGGCGQLTGKQKLEIRKQGRE